MAGYRDHDRNIRIKGLGNEVGETLALAFLPAEAVDDHDVGSLVDRACNTLAGIEQTADVEPTSARTRAEVLEQRQFFPGVKEPREKRGPRQPRPSWISPTAWWPFACNSAAKSRRIRSGSCPCS